MPAAVKIPQLCAWLCVGWIPGKLPQTHTQTFSMGLQRMSGHMRGNCQYWTHLVLRFIAIYFTLLEDDTMVNFDSN